MAVVAASLAMTPTAGATPSHPGGVDDTCPEVLAGTSTGGVEKLTSPPAGSEVSRGGVVAVTLRWNPAAFAGPLLHKALDCVTIDGRPSDDLSVQVRDTPNDGEFTTRMTVPAGLTDGAQLCDRGFVSGPAPQGTFGREKSNDVCFIVRGDVAVITVPAQGGAPAESAAPETETGAAPVPTPTSSAGPESGPAPAVSASPATQLALATPSSNTDDLGLGSAGHGAPGTQVAGAGDVADRPGPTLPKTGADISWTALAGLTAVVSGRLARRAGRRP
jgi:LPXTG-motif cell wall-anchored protein